LKQWANSDDRRLCEHKLIPGGHGVRPRRPARRTGYQVDLYRIDGVPNDIAQDFEKWFMHLVDTSRALERIIAGESDNWPGPLRSGWTRFILSLLFCNPEAVATIKGHIIERFFRSTMPRGAEGRSRDLRGIPREARAKCGADRRGQFPSRGDRQRGVGKTVFEMKWSRIGVSFAARSTSAMLWLCAARNRMRRTRGEMCWHMAYVARSASGMR
jgi:hypothetical protein